jgi:hypothetical protein
VMARRKTATERPRGRHFPRHPKLTELLRTFDPAIGPFRMEISRRNARDLRKWFQGPEAAHDEPLSAGLRFIKLPQGWELRLGYLTPPNPPQPGKVIAVFRPPREEEAAPKEPTAEAPIDSVEPAEKAPALV